MGKVLISLDSQPISEYPLKAAEAVQKMTFGNGMKILFSRLITFEE